MALEDLYDKLIASLVVVARRNSVMPRLIARNVAAELEMKGGSVTVSVSQPKTAAPVVPGATPPGGVRSAPKTVNVGLDYWEDSSFSLTDADITQMGNSDTFIPTELETASAAVSDRVDGTILGNYTGVYGFAGLPGTTPFGTTTAEAQDATRVLLAQGVPMNGLARQLVLDPFAYTNALGLRALQDASARGDNSVINTGLIGSALGFDWHPDQSIPFHTTGAAGTPLVNGAGQTGMFLNVDGFTTKPSVGDVFTIAGQSQTYVVLSASDLVGTASQLAIAPSIVVAPADNAALTFKASHRVNVAFHPSAFAFASRVASGIQLPDRGAVVRSWMDEVSGLILTLRINPEHYQTSFYVSCMWGTKLVDPRLAARLAG